METNNMAEFMEMTDLEFTHGWTKNMLSMMEKAKDENVDTPELMRRCSSFCYGGKHIGDMVEPISSVEEFVACLKNDFGWGHLVHYVSLHGGDAENNLRGWNEKTCAYRNGYIHHSRRKKLRIQGCHGWADRV